MVRLGLIIEVALPTAAIIRRTVNRTRANPIAAASVSNHRYFTRAA
jgi:hypothetical protein